MPQRQRILHLSRQLPHLPICGARIRNWQHIQQLRTFADVAVFCIHIDRDHVDIPLPTSGLHSYQAHYPTLSVSRLWNFAKSCLQHFDIRVTDLFYDKNIAKKLDTFLETFHPDVVIFSEPWLYRYVSIVQKHTCKIIFDMHNIEIPLRKEICLLPQPIFSRIRTWLLYHTCEAIEEDFILLADQVWTCSDKDTAFVRSQYKEVFCRTVPSIIDTNYYQMIEVPVAGLAPTILFCGNFRYPPNVQAAMWLLEDIFPAISLRHNTARLLLVGNAPTSAMQHAAQKNSNILLTGTIDDVRPYLTESSIIVVPLKIGGGTRLKVLEAFAAHRPVVSTVKGVEGIHVEHNTHCLIGESTQSIADHIETLITMHHYGSQLSNAAYKLLQESYSKEEVCNVLQNLIERDSVENI